MTRIQHLFLYKKFTVLLKKIFQECEQFPKNQRFILSARLQEASLDFLESLIVINSLSKREMEFQNANIALEKMRVFLTFAKDLRFLSHEKCAVLLQELEEMGRMLGGWERSWKERGR